MPEFHPILSADWFLFGTTTNGLEHDGCGVEMGDAVFGMVCDELGDGAPPGWSSATCRTRPSTPPCPEPRRAGPVVRLLLRHVRLLDERQQRHRLLGDDRLTTAAVQGVDLLTADVDHAFRYFVTGMEPATWTTTVVVAGVCGATTVSCADAVTPLVAPTATTV